MTRDELWIYLADLLIDDNDKLSALQVCFYIDKIFEQLEFCKITFKSVEEISLHEFKIRSGNILKVRVIYNGDFEHNFDVYGLSNGIYKK